MDGREAAKEAARMLLDGATLKKEPCPYCGGVRVMRGGHALCVGCGRKPEAGRQPGAAGAAEARKGAAGAAEARKGAAGAAEARKGAAGAAEARKGAAGAAEARKGAAGAALQAGLAALVDELGREGDSGARRGILKAIRSAARAAEALEGAGRGRGPPRGAGPRAP